MRPLLLPLLRRSVAALAIAQLAMVAVVPPHDGVGSSDRGPVRIEAEHQHSSLPAHHPDNCPICQLLGTPLLRTEEGRTLPAAEHAVRPANTGAEFPAARGPPASHQTRAPPSLA